MSCSRKHRSFLSDTHMCMYTKSPQALQALYYSAQSRTLSLDCQLVVKFETVAPAVQRKRLSCVEKSCEKPLKQPHEQQLHPSCEAVHTRPWVNLMVTLIFTHNPPFTHIPSPGILYICPVYPTIQLVTTQDRIETGICCDFHSHLSWSSSEREA